MQGPPGTGKSHTIVNLICHALAAGQRVLVTSHAVRALKVLQRMIRESAPDLAPLSVVLLGDDRNALLAMEESVQGITTGWLLLPHSYTFADLGRSHGPRQGVGQRSRDTSTTWINNADVRRRRWRTCVPSGNGRRSATRGSATRTRWPG